MTVIIAEKEDMAAKIAAALDCITLPSGKKITTRTLAGNEKDVKRLQSSQGYIDIRFEGKPCKVTWALGHLYGLKDVFNYNKDYKSWSARPIVFIPEKFELQPIVSNVVFFEQKNKKQRDKIKELFSKADIVINATDDDREGEVIFSYIHEATKYKKTVERVKLVKTTEEGIRTAFRERFPASKRRTLELAGRARNIYDWLIGTNLTTQFTVKNPGNGVLSVGRVQTTVLKMIVERDQAISNFVSKPFWRVKAQFITTGKESYEAIHEKERFDTREDAEKLLSTLNGKNGVVTNIISKSAERTTPLLYSQTLLAIEANKQFGYTAEKTLQISQWLYEQGYTTYPRTKSQVLNDDMLREVIRILEGLKVVAKYKTFLNRPLTPHKKYFNSAKVDSHYAIIPTEKIPTTLTNEQNNIYNLIACSLIRTIYPDAVIENTTITTTVDKEQFISKGSMIVEYGWLVVGEKIKEEFLPALTKGDNVNGEYEIREGKTNPPKQYNDASILSSMVSAGRNLDDDELKKILATESVNGIGTDATRANIIETLIKREYIERKAKTITATEKGIDFITFFPVEELKSAAFTAEMEKRLSDIEKGTEKFEDFIKDIKEQTAEWCYLIHRAKSTMKKDAISPLIKSEEPEEFKSIKKSKNEDVPCPTCGKIMTKKKNSFGEFYGCSGYPACRTTQQIVKKTAAKCPKCSLPIVQKKSKAGKIFYSCSGYPDCTQVYWDKPTSKKCPQCYSVAVVNSAKNTKYKCSNSGCGVKFD